MMATVVNGLILEQRQGIMFVTSVSQTHTFVQVAKTNVGMKSAIVVNIHPTAFIVLDVSW
jgi:hypothetical protein